MKILRMTIFLLSLLFLFACSSSEEELFENSEATCSDLDDNDGDGSVDCEDSDCSQTAICGAMGDSDLITPYANTAAVYPSFYSRERLLELYNDWRDKYFEYGAKSGYPNLARIKFDNPEQTVSEGIAYGMLIMATVNDSAHDTEKDLLKLWNYYKAFPNDNGAMHWKIDAFEGKCANNCANGATDAELDAAVALILAGRRWNKSEYITEALWLIDIIRNYELETNTTFLLDPGDKYSLPKNPSYASIAGMRLFAQVDVANSATWNSAIDANYQLLFDAQNDRTGLFPDWSDNNGKLYEPTISYRSYDYKSDAIRTPWRIAWDWYWFSDDRARQLNSLLSTWIERDSDRDPAKLKRDYLIDGSQSGSGSNAGFVGSFCLAASSNPEQQEWMDACFARLQSLNNGGYFPDTLQLLFMLLLTGNFPNFPA